MCSGSDERSLEDEIAAEEARLLLRGGDPERCGLLAEQVGGGGHIVATPEFAKRHLFICLFSIYVFSETSTNIFCMGCPSRIQYVWSFMMALLWVIEIRLFSAFGHVSSSAGGRIWNYIREHWSSEYPQHRNNRYQYGRNQ